MSWQTTARNDPANDDESSGKRPIARAFEFDLPGFANKPSPRHPTSPLAFEDTRKVDLNATTSGDKPSPWGNPPAPSKSAVAPSSPPLQPAPAAAPGAAAFSAQPVDSSQPKIPGIGSAEQPAGGSAAPAPPLVPPLGSAGSSAPDRINPAPGWAPPPGFTAPAPAAAPWPPPGFVGQTSAPPGSQSSPSSSSAQASPSASASWPATSASSPAASAPSPAAQLPAAAAAPASEKPQLPATLPNSAPAVPDKEREPATPNTAPHTPPHTPPQAAPLNRRSRFDPERASQLLDSSMSLPQQKKASPSNTNWAAIISSVLVCIAVGAGAAFLVFPKAKQWLVSSNNTGAASHENLGEQAYKQGLYSVAYSQFNEALQGDPQKAELYHSRGRVAFALQQFHNALDDYNKALSLKPDMTAALINRAATFYYLGEYSKALADYDKVISTHPNMAEAYFSRALCYWKLHNHEKTLADLKKSLQVNSKYLPAQQVLGGAYYARGDYHKAITAYDTALKLDPSAADVYFNRATTENKAGQTEKAESDYTSAIELHPGKAEYFNDRGYTRLKLGQIRQSLEDFLAATELSPNYKLAHDNLQDACHSVIAKQAKDLDGKPGALETLALAYVGLGDNSRALEAADKAVKSSSEASEQAAALLVKGECELADRQYERAITDETAALAKAPQRAEAHFFMARAHLRLLDARQAIAQYNEFLSKNDISPWQHAMALLERGIAYGALNKAEESAHDANAYIKLAGWDSPYAGTAALLQWLAYKDEQPDDALKVLDEAQAKMAPGRWPYPILRYLKHEISANDLTSSAHDKKQLTDAHAWICFDKSDIGLTSDASQDMRWIKSNGDAMSYSYILAAGRGK